MSKKINRMRRASKARSKFKELNAIRLVVHRTLRHIYAQVISKNNSEVLASASTVEKTVGGNLAYTGNKSAAAVVGKEIALRALDKGINKVSFDRSGFKYHGRIKALADSARSAGLNF